VPPGERGLRATEFRKAERPRGEEGFGRILNGAFCFKLEGFKADVRTIAQAGSGYGRLSSPRTQ